MFFSSIVIQKNFYCQINILIVFANFFQGKYFVKEKPIKKYLNLLEQHDT